MSELRSGRSYRGVLAAAVATVLAAAACGSDSGRLGDPPRNGGSGLRTIEATPYAQVLATHPHTEFGPNTTMLEGGAFGPNGNLYFVDVSAAPGEPKVLRLDAKTKETKPVYTDDHSTLSSVQFSPRDHKMYVTDFHTGAISRMNPDGTEFATVFSTPVDGRAMAADDLAFDPDGNMYITDWGNTQWDPVGRIVRLDADGTNPIVLQGGLRAPNGISFNPDSTQLWISELSANREDRFTLSEDRRAVTIAAVGMHINDGRGYADSNAVDTAGNIYQCMVRAGKVLVWNPAGDLVATINVGTHLPKPQTMSTNIAIRPGTTDGYLTVGGENGGYIYAFTALAPGGAQSNGGGAVFPQ